MGFGMWDGRDGDSQDEWPEQCGCQEGGDGLRATGFEMQRYLPLRLETGGPRSRPSRRLQEDRLLDDVQ